ncbi:UDP-3-O-(3-hydroxymyristoyl)glucosamine N-acyltransferase [Candidatus Liberibacter sp.]|uniref:UDP-3-O-(3-hydroxymyristoyl)glucosamine N-acyltransferase n=1 Tax=Candidatus Liberibacter sp. TaxID=34022 RepID=UPI0015F6E142|nr:UDP-3-O-(3-hydroxymyristoyl)glucosamine N-acyltransferase [Candidatus Liberibacter sp.]MBA5724458.1 UDP-3-O-(3-hydroxymyristoyl)glucosamine N-acyltransferase [Candidatus Liberibacter sp.]
MVFFLKNSKALFDEKYEFFSPNKGVPLAKLAQTIGAILSDKAFSERLIFSLSSIAQASEGKLSYIVSRKYLEDIKTCSASAIVCHPDMKSFVPKHIPCLLSDMPDIAFAIAGSILYPEAMRPKPISSEIGRVSPMSFLDKDVRLEENVTIEPMAVVGSGVEIGMGTYIGPGVTVGSGVKIGRNCSIAAGASVFSAFIGNDVILHAGARIGSDGFGYARDISGIHKIVQIGRVIIQDKVEIGANTTVDRGAMDDTIIGEGTKIDNQVQIGHNVYIGCGCIIVSQVGIAGSARIGDNVVIAGQCGIANHVHIGDGVQIAAKSGVLNDLPSGGKYGGFPARPMMDYLRYIVMLGRSSKNFINRVKGENDW